MIEYIFEHIVIVNGKTTSKMKYTNVTGAPKFQNEDGMVQIDRQYTGLKDKNGVDIYEGDIVEHDLNSEIFIGFVEFKEGCFGVYDKEKHFDSWVFDYDWKVIGNIHENSELLK